RHLVHHRRGDEKRERHAERNAGGDEADEQRHGGTGAERRSDAEERGEHVARRFAPSGEKLPRAFRREEASEQPDDENDGGEEKQDPRHLEEKELDRRPEMASTGEMRDVIREEQRDALQLRIEQNDRREGGDRERG